MNGYDNNLRLGFDELVLEMIIELFHELLLKLVLEPVAKNSLANI